MIFSLSDLYPEFNTPTTTDATIPEQEENKYYNEQTTPNNKLVPKNYIFGTIALLIALLLVIHFIK